MTIGLSYNDDISRVQVSVTGLPFDSGTIKIERSTNGVYWETVRGAAALPVSGGAAAVDDLEFSADVENTYRVSPVDPMSGLYLPGETGAYASTPDDPALDITGDIDLRCEYTLPDWGAVGGGGASRRYLVSKWTTGSVSYLLGTDERQLRLVWSPDGAAAESVLSTVVIPVDDGGRIALRVTRDATTGDVDFYTADGIDGSWSQLGATVTGPSGSIHAGTSVLEIGTLHEGTTTLTEGVAHAAEVRSGIGGAVVADPDFTAQSMDAGGFTDDAGRAWTVHGDAYLVGTETASITPSLDGFAWFKSIKHPFLNRPIHRVLAGGGQEIGRAARDGVFQVQGRSVPIVVSDVRSSRGFNLTIQVADESAARDMDLILASGDVFFIHVPPELTEHMSGGYVRIGDTVQHRVADTIKWRFELPCTVVAKPGPGVVGGTMTYGALLNLYGGYQNVLAANATYADVLALMASPEDLVVLP